jgi:formate/nitrite transporter FocA (FNT family)
MKGLYGKGVILMVIGGASLADHITYGVDAFPLSAIVFGLGFILVCMSYGKE